MDIDLKTPYIKRGQPLIVLKQDDFICLKYFYSPALFSASSSTEREIYKPERISISMTGLAWGITPRFFKTNTMPSVPRTGIFKYAAHLRPARSSMMASIPGCLFANARTDDSPGPNPQFKIFSGTGVAGTTSSHGVLLSFLAVMSSGPLISISSATG